MATQNFFPVEPAGDFFPVVGSSEEDFFPIIPRVEDRSFATELGLGLRSGYAGMKASIGGSLEMAGAGLEIEELRSWGRKIREGSDEEALRYMPRVTRVEDIHSADDFGDWLAYAVGSLGPSVGAAIGGGIAGAAIGSGFGGVGAIPGSVVGATVGAGSISYILNSGEVYADMIEQGVDSPAAAALAGIPMALLDVIVPTKVAGKLVWTAAKKQIVGGVAKRLLKEVPKTALMEAGTEATQELIGAGTAASQGAGEFMSPETASRILNAFSVGFVGGGLFGGMAEMAPQKGPFRPVGGVSGVDVPVIPTVEEIAQIAQGPTVAEEPTAPVGDLPGDREEQVVGRGETKGPVSPPPGGTSLETPPAPKGPSVEPKYSIGAPAPEPGPLWFSGLRKAIMDKMPRRASRDQVRAIIGPKNAVKPDEVKWTGLDQWLGEQTGPVTKEEVLAYLDKNEVVVTEVVREEYPAKPFTGTATRFHDYVLPGGKDYRELLMKWKEPGRAGPYVSPHFNEPDVLLHMRFNERTDKDGSRVLFVEEIQAERAQEEQAEGIEPTVPFATTPAWTQLAFRRAVRWAAENGFDSVAWTTGKQQIDRYQDAMRQNVDEVRYKEGSRKGTWRVDAIKSGKEVFDEDNIDSSRLRKLLGKALAGKIERGEGTSVRFAEIGADDWKGFSGDDLSIGGQKLKLIYDEILPNYAKKFGKKWGAKLERKEVGITSLKAKVVRGTGGWLVEYEDRIGGQTTLGPYSTREDAESEVVSLQAGREAIPVSVLSLPITDSMRESVLQGQPLFSLSPKELQNRVGETIVNAETVRETFPTAEVGQDSPDNFHLRFPNGARLDVKLTGELQLYTGGEDLHGYGRVAQPGEFARGKFQFISGISMITLGKFPGIKATLDHEAFHAAWAMVLTEEEQAGAVKAYGSEEAAARAYEAWTSGKPPETWFAKIRAYFRELVERLFKLPEVTFGQIQRGEVWERDAYRWIFRADGPTFSLGTPPVPLPDAFAKHGGEYVKWLSEQVNKPVEEFMGIEQRYLPDAVKGMTALEAYPHLPRSIRRWLSFKEWAKEHDKDEVVGDILPEHALSIDRVRKVLAVAEGDPEFPSQITKEMVHVGMGVKWFHTLIQVVDRNPWAEPAKRFLNIFRDGWQPTKTAITMAGDDTVKTWRGLGTKQEAALSHMRGRAAAEHLIVGRNLTQDELAKIAKDEGVTPATLEMYPQITEYLHGTIEMLKEAKLASLEREGENTPTEVARIEEEFASYLDNNDYFPAMRFGPHWNVVRAVEAMNYQGRKVKAGGLVWAEAFSTRTERDWQLKKLRKRFTGAAFAVSDTYMPPNTASFQGIPPSALETLKAKLKLNKEQDQLLRDIQLGLTPGRSFVKQLSRREGIAGESREGTRVLATYAQSIASHIARLKYKGELDQAIRDMGKMAREAQDYGGPSAKIGELQEILQQNLDYNMDPGYDFASIRSGLFWYYFVFMPKQAIVNLAQIPMLAYPYLAATLPRSGGKSDLIAMRELSKAMIDLGANAYKRAGLPGKKAEEPTLRLSPRDQRHMTRGVKAGFVKESYAADVAGAASGKILHRLLPGKRADAIARRMTEIGIMPFALSEEYNRRVTHLAAGRIGQQMGWTEDQTFEYGRSAVESTMFEYASWNRFKAARGKPAVLFLFKTFLQHATYFTFAHPGKGRFMGMMLLAGGVSGLTGAEDLLDLLDGIGSALKRKLGLSGDPRVELRKELREFATALSIDPDLFMHGLGRSSFGLHQLGKLFGVPIPAMDFASSIQLGRVIPGVEPISEALGQGKADWPHLFTRTAQDVAGAGGSMVMNWARATVTDSPDANYWLKVVAPAFIRSYLRYGEYKAGAARDWRGEKLVEFDPENVEHQAEVLGQLLGVMPRRVRQVQDTRWEFYEMIQFYTTRREILLTQYAYAGGNKLQEQKASVVKEILRHNKNVPPEFSISPTELRQSYLRRTKNRKMREMGRPTQKRFIRLYRNFLELYPAPVE